MQEVIITCSISDWLNYRWEHIGSSEVALAKFKIYEGVFNLSWKSMTNLEEVIRYFANCNSIITTVTNGEMLKKEFGECSKLQKYAPILKDGNVVYTEKEVA